MIILEVRTLIEEYRLTVHLQQIVAAELLVEEHLQQDQVLQTRVVIQDLHLLHLHQVLQAVIAAVRAKNLEVQVPLVEVVDLTADPVVQVLQKVLLFHVAVALVQGVVAQAQEAAVLVQEVAAVVEEGDNENFHLHIVFSL